MGQEYSSPKPGTKLRVIGAGLPRTGTASFTRALETLLDGPVFHGGTQMTLGPPREMQTAMSILRLLFPPRLAAPGGLWTPDLTKPPHDYLAYNSARDIPAPDRARALKLIRRQLDGYAAVTDSPYCNMVPELLELYPDAVVICTVRDVPAWVKSMAQVESAAMQGFLRVVLYWMPTMRWFPDYIDTLMVQWATVMGYPSAEAWERHMAKLKQVVPEDKLVFYDVREGWGPLCKVLGMDVPEGVEFPRINDGKAIDDFAARTIGNGLLRWLAVVGTIGVTAVGVYMAAR